MPTRRERGCRETRTRGVGKKGEAESKAQKSDDDYVSIRRNGRNDDETVKLIEYQITRRENMLKIDQEDYSEDADNNLVLIKKWYCLLHPAYMKWKFSRCVFTASLSSLLLG